MRGVIFTDCYIAEQLSPDAKSRFEIVESTESYLPFETLLLNKVKFNIGGLSFNYCKYGYSKANPKRVPAMSISRTEHISGVFIPNLQKNYIGYGDIKGTNDAVIILFDEGKNRIELFIARGYKKDAAQLYTEVANGNFEIELLELRQKVNKVLKESYQNSNPK